MYEATNTGEQPHQYGTEEARAIFRNAVRAGAMRFPRRARQSMRERRVDTNDILKLAKTGMIVKAPELDSKTHEWAYRIESDELNVVFVIPNAENVRLITVFTNSCFFIFHTRIDTLIE